MASTNCILLGILLLSDAVAQAQQGVVVARFGDRLQVLDETLKTVRLLPFRLTEYSRFSVNTGLAGVAVRKRCDPNGGGDLYFLQVPEKAKKLTWSQHFLLGPFEKDETEVYAEPALSPSGKLLAFVVRPCNLKRQLDLVESSGVVVLFDRVKGRPWVLPGTKNETGAAIGFANNPTWSADEKLLYVNFETGFRVLRAVDGTVASEYPPQAKVDTWSNAVGWIGSRCIVFTEGKDFREAEENPLLVLNIEKKESKRLDSLLEEPRDRIARIVSLQWPYVLSANTGKLSLAKLGRNGFAGRLLTGADQAVLIFRENNDFPLFCRP